VNAPALESALPLRRLGRGGPLVTCMGLGMAALGRPGYMVLGHSHDLAAGTAVERMRAGAWRMLDAAWAAGIRYFDAARSYGRAEEFLGGWLAARGIAPGELCVASKWGYRYTAEWRVDAAVHEVKEHSLAQLQRQWGESEALLGHWLSLYQIHSATLESGVLENGAVMERLGRLREGGTRIGLSVTGPRQGDTIRRAVEVRMDGEPLFSAVQATWNLLEPSAGEALAEAHAAGLGVVVKEALANGNLTGRGAGGAWASAVARIDAAAKECGVGVDALALAAVLAQPWADVVLSGAVLPGQLEANLAALGRAGDPVVAELLGAGLAVAPKEYWEERARLPWS
jgi:aryl-alcohol dehydrogenase-like predicted oxidoreductase